MKQFADSNVVAAAARGNELARQALTQSGFYDTSLQGPVAQIAVDVAEELFEEFSDEAGVVCEPFADPHELALEDAA